MNARISWFLLNFHSVNGLICICFKRFKLIKVFLKQNVLSVAMQLGLWIHKVR